MQISPPRGIHLLKLLKQMSENPTLGGGGEAQWFAHRGGQGTGTAQPLSLAVSYTTEQAANLPTNQPTRLNRQPSHAPGVNS